MGRISGPLMDRFDLRVEVPPVSFQDLELPANGDCSKVVAARVADARERQRFRYEAHADVTVNADASGALLDEVATPDAEGKALLGQAAERIGLSARGYHRVMRVARTIADLAGEDAVTRRDIAEAISFRIAAGHRAKLALHKSPVFATRRGLRGSSRQNLPDMRAIHPKIEHCIPASRVQIVCHTAGVIPKYLGLAGLNIGWRRVVEFSK